MLKSSELVDLENKTEADAWDIATMQAHYESGLFDKNKLATTEYQNRLEELLLASDIEDNPIVRILYYK